MKDLPERKLKGKFVTPELQEPYSQIILQFLADPTDIENNSNLKIMEYSLQLTLNLDKQNSS
jgi:hypothetical protein